MERRDTESISAEAAPVELALGGPRCAGCSDSVRAALLAVPGVTSAEVSFAASLALVRRSAAIAPPVELLREAVVRAGYRAEASGATAAAALATSEAKGAVAALLLAVAQLLLEPKLAPFGERFGLHGAGALFATAALVGPGRSFLRGAWHSLKSRVGTMDLLVAIGATGATLSSWLAAFGWLDAASDHGHAATWLIAALRVGKGFEARVRALTAARLTQQLEALPARAIRLEEGSEREVDAALLSTGDRIVVAPAAAIPADALVVSGRSDVDESKLTGEPLPVAKSPGARLFAGTVNGGGRLIAEVTAAASESRLTQVAAQVRAAIAARPPVVALADRIARRFVPLVVLLAAATALGWWLAGASAATIVARGLATVVVSCPCALALATPGAIVAGVSAALRHGIVVKDAAVLEALATIRSVWFDKTGTLTRGEFVVAAVPFDRMRERERDEAFTLASASRHPAAAAIARALETKGARRIESGAVDAASAMEVEERPGQGVVARVGSHELRLGRPEFAAPEEETPLSEAGTLVAFSRDGRLLARFELADELRPSARAACDAARALGLRLGVVSGDRPAPLFAIAQQLQIEPDRVHAGVSPEAKARLITEETARAPTLFVGDGFNDGGALAAATVGAAQAGGTDLARAAGRLVLLRDDPADAIAAVAIGRATVRVIRQNLLLALLYNVIAIPWAMGLLPQELGAASPTAAGLAMAASSLAVVLNALRLARSNGGR